MSSVTAPNGALSVQSQNQPVQSEENCCQRVWRWISETAGCIWEAVMGFFRGLCCSQPSSQQSSIVAQTSSQATTRQVAPTVVTTGSATEPTPSAPPRVPPQELTTLPSGAVRTDAEITALFTSAGIPQTQNVWIRQKIRLTEVTVRQRLPVGCLLSSMGGTPAVYIVVPYAEGLEEILRPLPRQGAGDEQWRIYIKDGQRFFACLHCHYTFMQNSNSLPAPLVSLLPNGTVYFDPNPSAERALKEQLGGQLRHPTVDRRSFTDLMDRNFINDTFSTMRSVQGRLQREVVFDMTVGCLLSRYNNEPALFIVVPYRDGVVEFLRREVVCFGAHGDGEPEWQIYTDGNRRFIGGYWQRLPRERTGTEELPPALVPYVGPPLP